MKRCTDCKFYERNDTLYRGLDKCTNPKSTKPVINPIDGSVRLTGWVYCETNRNLDWLVALFFSGCGKKGRFFEHKDAP